jgi:hypothetical protein
MRLEQPGARLAFARQTRPTAKHRRSAAGIEETPETALVTEGMLGLSLEPTRCLSRPSVPDGPVATITGEICESLRVVNANGEGASVEASPTSSVLTVRVVHDIKLV